MNICLATGAIHFDILLTKENKMYLRDILSESCISITTNKLRTILTMLGVVIGICAVVIMIAAGQTVEHKIISHFSDLGTNTIMLRARATERGGIKSGHRMTLTTDDIAEIAKLPGVAAITPAQMGMVRLVHGNQNLYVAAVGAYPDYKSVLNIDTEYGDFFNMDDVQNSRSVAIIGPRALYELGMPENSTGKTIRINNMPFTIIGTTKTKGDTALGSQDDMIIIPLSTFKKRLVGDEFPNSVPVAGIRLTDNADNNLIIEQITSILRMRHKLRDSDPDDFQFFDMKQIMESLNSVVGNMQILIIAVAAISLIVGGIGIMNMMLASVTERTREIGIRKSIGACEKYIIIQFLTESVLISLTGGLIGLILGISIAHGVGRGILHFYVPFSIWPIVVSLFVSVCVGIFSGILPAIRASKLNPIDCMRHE